MQALLDGLNPAQAAAVTSTARPLGILAGAGSGKTRVLTRRIAYRVLEGSADPARILALTFTRKAAGELTKRIGQLGVRERIAAGTFHAIAYAQLRQWWTDTDQKAPQLTESKMRYIAPLVGARRSTAVQPIDVVTEVEWAKARLLTPDTYEAEARRLDRKPPLGVEAMADIYRRYEAEKKRKGVVDFDDLLLHCVRALESDREFAARQQWRFRHLFVDEFQDVNPAQYRLLQGWLGLSPAPSAMSAVSSKSSLTSAATHGSAESPTGAFFSPNPVDLCVVGDPNQAIYAWNGADPRFLTGFSAQFPTAEIVRLEDNYRSTPQILTVADAVLGLGQRDSRALRPNRSDGPIPTVTAYASDLDEARAIARALRDRHSTRLPWSKMAVLTRTNAQALLFEEAFRAASIPHRVRAGGMFLQQPEVKAALEMIRRSPGAVPFGSIIRDIEEMAADAAKSGVLSAEGTNDRAANLDGLVRLAHEFVGVDSLGNGTAFLQWLPGVITSRADEPTQSNNVVEISTFHRSKGLEWPIVFLAGLERGYVPIGQADNQDAWDEERRLLYVAVTRAEHELHCSWARTRTFGTRTTNRNESPWLANIEAARSSLANPDGGDWQALLRAQRERLAAAKASGVPGIRGTRTAAVQVGSGADPRVFDALKQWRAQTARATGVPAFVICHDTTLAAIAELQPDDTAGLLTLPGMGPVKVDRYGASLLAALAQAKAS